MPPVKFDFECVPADVRAVAAALGAAGGRVWLVGGPVRDRLRGEAVVDFDFATDLPPERVAAALPGVDARDANLGACKLATTGLPVVVTTLRTEADYQDHRRPGVVTFVTDVVADARRRDFTVNALYAAWPDGDLLDPTGGLMDLQAGVLRMIGEPTVRFAEDALRLLRAVRFGARLTLRLHDDTAAAARSAAGLLSQLSAERVWQELTAMFIGPGRGRALRLLVELGFAAVLLPEVAAMDGVTQPPEYHPEGDVLTHVAMVLDHVPAGDPVLAWAAVLHDVGKPPTWRQADDRIRFDGHDVLSATMAEAILARLHAPQALREAVAEICRDHIRFAAFPGMRPRRRQRWMRTPHFAQHLAFHRADCLGSHGKLGIWQQAAAEFAALPPDPGPPLLTGADVLALGVPSGPCVGMLLRRVEVELDGLTTVPTRDDALVLLRDLSARGDQEPGTDRR